jgi:hypothetical protein
MTFSNCNTNISYARRLRVGLRPILVGRSEPPRRRRMVGHTSVRHSSEIASFIFAVAPAA